MSSTQQPIRSMRILLGAVVAGGLHFGMARCAGADQSPPVVAVDRTDAVEPQQASEPRPAVAPPQRQSAVATDLDPASELAQELLRLQQQLGGSVVTDRAELQGWQAAPAPVTTRPTPDSASSPQFPEDRVPEHRASENRAPEYRLQPPLHSLPAWSAYPRRSLEGDSQANDSPGHELPPAARPSLEVTGLRAAAWQLATTAHRLEQLDLYDQADALRSLAQRLRQDARGRQQADRAAARAMLPGSSTRD